MTGHVLSYFAPSYPTKDDRIRLTKWAPGVWRTIVRDDDPPRRWDVTGPPYATKQLADAAVDQILADYFGDLPTRAVLAARIDRALAIAREYDRPGLVPARVVRMMAATLNGHPIERKS